MVKQRLIVLIGVQGSGKSTFAYEEQYRISTFEKKTCLIVSKDALRKMIAFTYTHSAKLEEQIHKMEESILKSSTADVVILDNTHCKVRYVKDIIDKYSNKYDIELEIIGENLSLDELLVRNTNRLKIDQIPEEHIKRFYQSFQHLLTQKEAIYSYLAKANSPSKNRSAYINYESQSGKTPTIICDIDGTLAHIKDRSPYDWGKVGEDKVDYHIRELVNNMFELGYLIILVSGRSGECREKTENWLVSNNVSYDKLYMRTKGDYRKDTIIKKEIYENMIGSNYDVRFVLDDRDCVVDTWREMGLKCLQVERGDF